MPRAAQAAGPSSLWVFLWATSLPSGRDWPAARSALLPRGTSLRFFADAPAPYFAASTAKQSPSARSDLPALAAAGLLHCPEKEPRGPAPVECAKYDPAWECSISTAGLRSVSGGLHPLGHAAVRASPDCDSRRHRCPLAARESLPLSLRFPRSGTRRKA